eukprot:scaffold748_cov251-Pinguiococcus_pyrenoidosus.AAC.31
MAADLTARDLAKSSRSLASARSSSIDSVCDDVSRIGLVLATPVSPVLPCLRCFSSAMILSRSRAFSAFASAKAS